MVHVRSQHARDARRIRAVQRGFAIGTSKVDHWKRMQKADAYQMTDINLSASVDPVYVSDPWACSPSSCDESEPVRSAETAYGEVWKFYLPRVPPPNPGLRADAPAFSPWTERMRTTEDESNTLRSTIALIEAQNNTIALLVAEHESLRLQVNEGYRAAMGGDSVQAVPCAKDETNIESDGACQAEPTLSVALVHQMFREGLEKFGRVLDTEIQSQDARLKRLERLERRRLAELQYKDKSYKTEVHSGLAGSQAASSSSPSKDQELGAANPASGKGMDAFVTAQHLHDSMRAGLEGVARTTATHLEKLEQRLAAIENKASVDRSTRRAVGMRLTHMTGMTRLVQSLQGDEAEVT